MKYDCKICDFHWEGTADTFEKVRVHEKTHEKKQDQIMIFDLFCIVMQSVVLNFIDNSNNIKKQETENQF